MYNPAITYASCNTSNWGKKTGVGASKQEFKCSSCSSRSLFSHLSNWGNDMKKGYYRYNFLEIYLGAF